MRFLKSVMANYAPALSNILQFLSLCSADCLSRLCLTSCLCREVFELLHKANNLAFFKMGVLKRDARGVWSLLKHILKVTVTGDTAGGVRQEWPGQAEGMHRSSNAGLQGHLGIPNRQERGWLKACATGCKEGGKLELITSLNVFLERLELYLRAPSYGCIGVGLDPGPLGPEAPINYFHQ